MIRIFCFVVATFFLSGWCALIGMGAVQLVKQPKSNPKKTTQSSAPPAVDDVVATNAVAQLPQLSDLRAIVTSPLFFKGRRLPRPEDPIVRQTSNQDKKAPRATIDPSAIILRGIYYQAPDRRALLEYPVSQFRWVTETQSVGGWSVEEITDSSVLLRSSGRSSSLKLYPDHTAD